MEGVIQLSTVLKQEIPTSVAWKYRVIPKSKNGESITLFSDQETEESKIKSQLQVLTGKKIQLEFIASSLIDEALTKYYLRTGGEKKKEFSVDSDNFINEVIAEAHQLGCSDIHIEPYQDRCRIRMRLDGKLIERYELRKEKYHEYINKVKIIANLDIAEKRLPQDGRIMIKDKTYQYDIRVSILPTLFGEKVVLRLLSSDASNLDIKDLGFTKEQFKLFTDAISRTQGMVLISGPTGSGKTTTLYGALKNLNTVKSNILTIEDPIEYTLEGINQVQLNEKIGLDFATALRTFLRQDPDIIMVGEIRDIDTAKIAVRAAMTGHLVMSTVHTNSAYGIISRLMEMGISDYLIADTLNVAVAQRLVRCLCPACKEMSTDLEVLPEELKGRNIQKNYQPKGCNECHGTGYKGRRAIYEVIQINNENRDIILKGENYPKSHKLDTLMDNALRLFEEGDTSLEEIYTYLI